MLRFILAGAMLFLAGCQRNAQEFIKPSTENLRLGYMMRQEIIAAYGEPTRQQTTRITKGDGSSTGGTTLAAEAAPELSLTELTYNYRDPLLIPLAPRGLNRRRAITFAFANDRLFGYLFNSSFDADTVEMDEAKVKLLENGRSTRADLVMLFGEPNGRMIFPGAPIGLEKYVFVYLDSGPYRTTIRRLDVLIRDDDRVNSFNFSREVVPNELSPVMPAFIRQQ